MWPTRRRRARRKECGGRVWVRVEREASCERVAPVSSNAVDNSEVFAWTVSTPGIHEAMGTTKTTISTGTLDPYWITVDASHVYFVNSPRRRRVVAFPDSSQYAISFQFDGGSSFTLDSFGPA
jgi:hypothetical protein